MPGATVPNPRLDSKRRAFLAPFMSVIITGASSGIGEACAWEYARAGNDLLLVARRADRLQKVVSAISAKYPKIKIEQAILDVRHREELETWAAAHAASIKPTQILVNNAGLARGFDELPKGNPEDWDVMIDTNIKGLLYASRIFFPALIANRGHIINIGSVAGHYTYPKGNVYAATKYAVRALNEGMRQDLHGTGVRVTEIAPGMVETEFSEVRFHGDQDRARQVYQGTRPLTPQDIAECVFWSTQRPAHVDIQSMLIFPTDQSAVGLIRRDAPPPAR
jgi:NADP-dependent 3-hydroxy acid dehydrogenase YdfG